MSGGPGDEVTQERDEMPVREPASLANVSFRSVAQYMFLYEIGRGGMGIVYLAERNSEQVIDYVVLKTIPSLSPEKVALLQEEANIATLLRHENIVKTYGLESVPMRQVPRAFQEEVGALAKGQTEPEAMRVQGPRFNPLEEKDELAAAIEEERVDNLGDMPTRADDMYMPAAGEEEEKLYMMVMDYVEGTDLNTLTRDHCRGGLLIPVELGAFIISRICRALGYAHKYIVHRDISPENILINGQGVAKLSDFGIAVTAGAEAAEMIGKFEYMAPEQLKAEKVDARSDIYSLGLVAYLVATGVNLHAAPQATSAAQRLAFSQMAMEEDVVPPCEVRKDIPQIYSDIIDKMLQKDPAARYQDVGETARDLEKRFLYASGFGPTNNSLEAYLQIFKQGFDKPTREQLQQLTFLARPDGRIHLRRRIAKDRYTAQGLSLIQRHPDSLVCKALLGGVKPL